MPISDYKGLRARRIAADKAATKARQKAELQRLRARATDLSSPYGYGPVHEALSPVRHVTPEPWDQSAPPAQRGGYRRDPSGGGDRGGF